MKVLDTYVLMEVYKGNKKFDRYLVEDFIINDLTLAEFFWVLLREVNETEAS